MRHLLFVLHPCTLGDGRDGWRWAVHLAEPGELAIHPLRGCVNAGWAVTEQAADEVGQLVLYSCMALLARVGVDPQVHNVRPGVDIVADLHAGGLELVQATPEIVVLAVTER